MPSGLTMRQGAMRGRRNRTRRRDALQSSSIPNTNDSTNSAGSHGHGAGTPIKLVDWWMRYICPPGGAVLDLFIGSGTSALAAINMRRSSASASNSDSGVLRYRVPSRD